MAEEEATATSTTTAETAETAETTEKVETAEKTETTETVEGELEAKAAVPNIAQPEKHWFWGLGRRKSSVARVRLKPGDGKFLIETPRFWRSRGCR